MSPAKSLTSAQTGVRGNEKDPSPLTSSPCPSAATDRGPTSRLFILALLAALVCVLAVAGPASAQQFDNFDPTFGSGGLVLSDMAGGASALALQPDGKIVLAGSATDTSGFQLLVVTRFNSDGSPDSTFGSGGRVAVQFGDGSFPLSGANAVALGPDGKIVVAGGASDSSGIQELLVARFTTDGMPDNSFSGDGKFLTQLGSNGNPSYLNAVAVQSDGKVVVGGQASDSDGNSRFLVGRLTTGGGWDSSFNGDGRVLTQIGKAAGLAEWVSSLAIQSDGKIVASGQAADANGQVALLATRLTSGGGFDSSFSGNGILLHQLGLGSSPLSRANAVALQSDGKVLLGGDATPANGNGGFMVTRLTSGGDFDSSFGAGGVVATQLGTGFNASSSIASLALQSDGNVVAAGFDTDNDGNSQILVTRLSGVNGNFDGNFGEAGKVTAQVGTDALPFSQAFATAVQPDGRILLGGVANAAGGTTKLMAARLFHDVAPTPVLRVLTNPAVAGAPVAFDGASSSDLDGSVTSYSWDFGDGSTATGATVSHTYASDGDYTVRLTVTDDKGVPASTTQTLTVTPDESLNPAFRATISRLGVTPKAFRAANKGGSISARTGAAVSYRDSRAAVTTFQIRQGLRGTFANGKCNKPKPGLHGRRCARYVKIGQFTHTDNAGLNRFHFTGRLKGKKLAPGRYRFRAVPSQGSRLGIAAAAGFMILP
jgi:uncharacterized delta-60 repeat protein